MVDFEQAKFEIRQIYVELGQKRPSWGKIRPHFGTFRQKIVKIGSHNG